MRKLRIIIAEDHVIVRAGLKAFLSEQPDFQIVGEAESAEAAVELARELKPDIAIVDIRMPGDGLIATSRMKHCSPQLKILIFSQYDDPAYLHRAHDAGASGYALKRASGQELLEAIRAVARGEVYLHPAMARILVEESWSGSQYDTSKTVTLLSEREEQVLRLIALGNTTNQIAQQLFLSSRTIDTYKGRLMEKLGLHGRTALVRYAIDNGLVKDGPPTLTR